MFTRHFAHWPPGKPKTMAVPRDTVLEGLRVPALADISRSGRRRLERGRYFVATPLAEAPGLYAAVSLPYQAAVREASAAFYRTLGALGLLTLFTIAAVFTAAELGILRSLRVLVGCWPTMT